MSDMTDAEILAMFHALNEDRQLKLLDDLERLLEEQRGEPPEEAESLISTTDSNAPSRAHGPDSPDSIPG